MDAAAHCETAPTLDLLAKGHVAPRIGTPGNMELDELENMAKSDFLPLLPLIKQEHLDNAETATTANPCDSVEKQVSPELHALLGPLPFSVTLGPRSAIGGSWGCVSITTVNCDSGPRLVLRQ